jgi:tetratricopeptide (TPR) repeat protein
LPALAGAALVLIYGGFFVAIDRAHLTYLTSVRDQDLLTAQQAERQDPHLNLYDLNVAYLTGQDALDDAPELIPDAIAAYVIALDLEPTWDVGWVNLAALYEAQGNLDAAIDALERARQINPLHAYGLPLARLLEATGSDDEDRVVALYYVSILRADHLPLAEFWTGTPLRRAALERYLAIESLRLTDRTRVLRAHDPGAIDVPESPETAAEWWVVGQAALDDGRPDDAESAFTRAIERDTDNGDLYASRARARVAQGDLDGAEADVIDAERYGTRREYPNAIRAQIATTPDEVERYRRIALPGRAVPQQFAAVVYGGRQALFDLPASMRPPGPGREALDPWYALAEDAIREGDAADARDIYRAILRYAPYEDEARAQLDALGG